MKVIDKIIKEPLGGAHNDIDLAAKRLKKVIIDDIKSLEKIKPDKNKTQHDFNVPQMSFGSGNEAKIKHRAKWQK